MMIERLQKIKKFGGGKRRTGIVNFRHSIKKLDFIMDKEIRLILPILFFTLSQTIYGQDYNDSLIKNNRVRSIKEISLEMGKGQIVSSELIGYKIFNIDYQLVEEYSKTYPFKYKYEYNSNGLLINKIKLDNKNDKSERVWEYEYDNDKRLVKEVSYWIGFKGKHPILYEYNEKNQLVSINYFNNKKEIYESETQKFYDSGELYERTHEEKYNKSAFKLERFDKCGNLIYCTSNTDKKETAVNNVFLMLCPNFSRNQGYIVDTVYNNSNPNEYLYYILRDSTRKSIYSYDSLGNLLKEAKYQFKPDGALNRSEERLYNINGDLIQYKEVYHWAECDYSSDIHTALILKKYEYYPNGLLHKVYFFDEKDLIYRIIEYEIEYY
jgi:hypothetical protein